MFGETEYDPTRKFCSISIEEQLDALGRALVKGKVRYRLCLYSYRFKYMAFSKEVGKFCLQIRYVGLSNETPYGVVKFVQAAQRDSCLPKIISVQV